MKRSTSLLMMSLCILAPVLPAKAQLRIVTYNTANGTFPSGNNYLPRTGMDNVLQAIGSESTNGIARPIDVLILQEQDDPDTTTQAFVGLLDGLYGAGTYAHSTVITQPIYTDNIRQTLIYNTHTVSLIDEKTFGITGSNYAARQTARFQLRPVGYDSSADFYVYDDHYKAGYYADDQARRDFEANTVRNDADALGQGASIIYAGDYNIESSNEAMYQTLTSTGNGQAFDPINTPGNWYNNSYYAAVHTQSPHDGSDGLVTGGMDDRFDFQLVTGELLDSEGMSYIQGSYHAFGNNGTTFNHAVNYYTNTYPVSQSVLDDLAHVSDHLPVVADYQLPAKMAAQVGNTTYLAIVGANVDVPVTVANAAPVQSANGADELDYNVSGSGVVTGSDSGTAYALQSGNVHSLSLDTSQAGLKTGSVQAQATSQSAANASFDQAINAIIFDHANASFSDSSDQDVLTIDFGSVNVGGVIDAAFDLSNLEQTPVFTADLDLDSIDGTGDTAALWTNLAAFSGLEAGLSNAFLASFDTSAPGDFSAAYTLSLSDQDLPGATGQTLTLQLIGQVLAASLPGDLNGDGYVGLDDLQFILDHWNQNVTLGDPLLGDVTGPGGVPDGYVGLDDLQIILDHWNTGTPSPGQPQTNIPEPASAAMLLLTAAACLNQRRHGSLEYA